MEFVSIIWLFFLSLILLAVFLLAMVFIISTMETLFLAKVPFVPVPKKVIDQILENLDLKEQSVLYDLGCGDARVLLTAAVLYPGTNFIGLEIVALPFYLAKIKKFWSGAQNVNLKQKNFFKEDLSSATHVFTYLLPKVMDNLLPKLERELKSGARLVSCDFKFSNKEPIEIVDLRRGKKLASFLYVYEF